MGCGLGAGVFGEFDRSWLLVDLGVVCCPNVRKRDHRLFDVDATVSAEVDEDDWEFFVELNFPSAFMAMLFSSASAARAFNFC